MASIQEKSQRCILAYRDLFFSQCHMRISISGCGTTRTTNVNWSKILHLDFKIKSLLSPAPFTRAVTTWPLHWLTRFASITSCTQIWSSSTHSSTRIRSALDSHLEVNTSCPSTTNLSASSAPTPFRKWKYSRFHRVQLAQFPSTITIQGSSSSLKTVRFRALI